MNLIEKIRRNRGRILVWLLLIGMVAWLIYLQRDRISAASLIAYGKGIPAVWFMLAFFLCPLVGAPINIFLLLAGARFGFWTGMALAAMGVLFHNFVAYYLVHRWLREPVKHRLERRGYRIPSLKGKNATFYTAIFVAIQGPPYATKLYLLALTDVPFRIYYSVGVPIYIFFCVVSVGIGSSALNLDPRWITLLVLAVIGMAIGGRWLKKRYGSEI